MDIQDEIKKAKNKDKEAFSNIINYYSNLMYYIAKSRLNSIHDIEDAIQDCSIKMYLNIGKLKDITKYKSWMTKILINCCNKIYSFKKGDISYDELEHNNLLVEFDKFNNLSFFELISFLEVEDRTIITMYYLDEYTTKEISEILGINESTLRSRVSNIRNKIKKSIERGERYER